MFEMEKEMEEPVEQWVLKQGYSVNVEVKAHGKIPDIVGYSGNEIYLTVELKLKNWKRALYQATINTVYTSESYIAMPSEKRKLLESKKQLFTKWGVGILLVHMNGEIEVFHTPLVNSEKKEASP